MIGVLYSLRVPRAKSLYGARQGKMETCSMFRRKPLFSANGISHLHDKVRLTESVTDCPAAIRAGEIELIGNRTAPVGTTLKGRQPITHSYDTTDIPGITVRVPAACVDD